MKKKKEIPLWAKTGHKKPVTRREFLAAGMIPFAASMVMPRWMNLLLPEKALALDGCPSAAPSGMIPVVTLNLSGGAALMGNFVPHRADGTLLSSYSKMGLGDNKLPIEREFGNVPFAGFDSAGVLISKILKGIRSGASPEALAGTAFVASCVSSRDDSSENRFAIDGLLAKAGLIGMQLPSLGRRSNSITGMGQMPAVVSPSSPLIVNSLTALTGSLGYAASVGASMNNNQKTSLAKLISRLSQSQSNRFLASPGGDEIKKVIDCAGVKNVDLVGQGSVGVDPRVDANVGASLSSAWGVDGGTNVNDQNLVFASMVYNALNGVCGSVALEMGGYDYHDNTRTTGDARDEAAGLVIGRVLQTAHIMKKPLFLYVTSDGTVSSADSIERNSPWRSDRGPAGGSYIIYYDPRGRRATQGFMIGHFTDGQVADTKTLTGGNAEMSAVAVFANYLALNNKLDLFNSIVGRKMDVSDLPKVLRFT